VGGCAALRATPPLPSRAGEPTEKSLFLFQKGGNLKNNMQRVFLAGRSGQTCPLGGGVYLVLFSSFAQNRF